MDLKTEFNKIPLLLKILVLFLTFGQRFVVRVGEFQVPMILVVLYFVIFVYLIKKDIKLDITKLLLFICCVIVFFICMMVANSSYSAYSFLYLALIYTPFIFVYKNKDYYLPLLNYYQKVMIVITFLGVVQFILPFMGIQYTDIFSYFPMEFVQSGYNTYYPIEFGSNINKSNGVVLLEPSLFSQFLAMSILIELIYFRNKYRIAIYLIGILITYSGTGLVILFIALALYYMKQNVKKKFLYLVLLVGICTMALNSNYTQILLKRTGEFNINSDSSANYRFLSPFLAIQKANNIDDKVYFTGLGPGAVDRVDIPSIPDGTNYSVIPKLMIEYGMFATFLFLVFIFYSFYKPRNSIVLFICTITMYLFLSGSLLQPQTVYYIYILFCFTPKKDNTNNILI